MHFTKGPRIGRGESNHMPCEVALDAAPGEGGHTLSIQKVTEDLPGVHCRQIVDIFIL